MKTEISHSEYLMIVGLLTLAKRYNEKIEDLVSAIREVTGDGEFGHATDAIYSDYSADDLLRRLGIMIVNPTQGKEGIAMIPG